MTKRFGTSALFSAILCSLVLAGCGDTSGKAEPLLPALQSEDNIDAAAKFIDREGNEIGYVVFTEAPGGNVLMRVDLKRIAPGWHGIHLHQVGDCSDLKEGFKLSGGHVDPDDNPHGLLNPEGYERADLPNIYAGRDGRATAAFFKTGLSLNPSEENAAANGPYPLLDDDGFAVIVHENPDDHISQPIGGAGGRIACAALDG